MEPTPLPVAIRPTAGSRLAWGLFVLGLALMGLGIWFGETARILDKATQVCLQCIGIG